MESNINHEVNTDNTYVISPSFLSLRTMSFENLNCTRVCQPKNVSIRLDHLTHSLAGECDSRRTGFEQCVLERFPASLHVVRRFLKLEMSFLFFLLELQTGQSLFAWVAQLISTIKQILRDHLNHKFTMNSNQ